MGFGTHQTFYIREGWLFKGMRAILDEPTVFSTPDVSERLGLGKNMVRALRFWLVATGLTQESREGQRTVQRLTEPFGKLVWDNDRFQEEEGTLWLLHYNLVRKPAFATAWYWFFNHFAQPVFDQTAFLSALQGWAIGTTEQAVSESLLARDFDCLIRTYLPDRQARSPEDLTECPLGQLGLLAEAEDGRTHRYRLLRPDAGRIAPLGLLYVILQWQEEQQPGSRQVSLAQVLREPGNAGRVFNLGTAGLSSCISRLNDEHPGLEVRLTRTAGLDELSLPSATSDEVLRQHFDSCSRNKD